MNTRIVIAAVAISLVSLGLLTYLVLGVLEPDASPWQSVTSTDKASDPAPRDSLDAPVDSSVEAIPLPAVPQPSVDTAVEDETEIAESSETGEPAPHADDDKGIVEIRVTDPAGAPRTDVLVNVWSAQNESLVASEEVDDDGRVSFVLPRSSYWAGVDAPLMDEEGARMWDIFGVETGQTTMLNLVLGSLDKTISGRVLDREGRGVDAIEIFARPFKSAHGAHVLGRRFQQHSLTDEDGTFMLEELSNGEYVLQTVAADGFGSERLRVLAPAEEVQIVVHREERLIVTGTVTESDNGEPVGGVMVVSSLGGMVAKSAVDGTYKIETRWRESPRAGVAITARREGFLNAEELIVAADTTRVEHIDSDESHLEVEVSFELHLVGAGGTVSGMLIDDLGEPVARERLFLYSKSRDVRYSATSSGLGAFRIKDVGVADDYRAWVYPRQAYKDFKLEPVSIEPGENELEITLESLRTGGFGGVIVKVDGGVMPFFSFRVRSMDSLANHRSVTTDEVGRFRVEDVPEGSLLVETHALPKVSVRGIKLEADSGISDLEIPVGFGDHRVAGHVVTSQGDLLGGVRVNVTWYYEKDGLTSQLQNETATDADGKFSVSGLGSGNARVHATTPGFLAQSARVTVDTEAAENVAISLKPKK